MNKKVHKTRFAWFVLLLGCVVILIVINLLFRIFQNSRSLALDQKQNDFSQVQAASTELENEVRETTQILDSLTIRSTDIQYQVYVVVSNSNGYQPVGVQLIDFNSHAPFLTEDLVRRDGLKCWKGLSYEPVRNLAYQTEIIRDPLILNYAQKEKREITLFVKKDDVIYTVTGLSIEAECASSVE